MSSVGALFLDLALALGLRNPTSIVGDVQRWAAQYGREGYVIRDTYDAWRDQVEKEAQSKRARKKREAASSHKGPRIAAALIIQEYLAAHRPEVTNEAAETRVQVACTAILSEGRKQRFERLPQDTNVDAATANSHHGVYVLIRWESFINTLVQELIILSPTRGRKKLRHVTVVGRGAVLRGHWNLFGASLYITAAGYRSGHRPEFVTMAFSLGELPNHAIGGVLTGLTTDGRVPVTAQVLAIKIEQPRPAVLALGDMPDPHIIDEFSKLVPSAGMDETYVELIRRMHEQVLKDELRMTSWFAQRIVAPTDSFVARAHQKSISELVHPKLLRFVTARRAPARSAR